MHSNAQRFRALIDQVERPSRYIGGEVNAIVKEEAELRFALCFPDIYELGMSHIGLRILYDILNGSEGIAAERCFAPWPDMRALLREEGVALPTLESGTPLGECHIVGFSYQYELTYPTMLEMLHLGGVPLRSRERGENDPLVCGGGPACFNPEPMAEFMDFFLIGDGEEAALELAELVRGERRKATPRSEILRKLSRIQGIYVPSLYAPEYDGDGRLVATRPVDSRVAERVTKALVTDLDGRPYPRSPVVPNVQTVHDRVSVEISRGCTQGCRFCQAGYIYRPVRERSPATVLDLVEDATCSSGYDEVSLSSLSTGDYRCLEGLVHELIERHPGGRLGVSMPSLKVGALTPKLIADVGRSGKSGFTIAPEAGSQRLRDVVNKVISDEEILHTVRDVFAGGWDSLKLYFMIGLPSETDEDIDGIADLVRRCLKVARRENPRMRSITASISTFVPKAHTPFQWHSQISLERTEAVHSRLRSRLRDRRIRLRWHDPKISWLEGILSRGDRRVGELVYQAWANGTYLDGWGEHLVMGHWLQALETIGLNPAEYNERQRDLDEPLPWDHIDSLLPRKYLRKEWEKAMAAATIDDCRVGSCTVCGVCDFKQVKNELFDTIVADTHPASGTRRSEVPVSALPDPGPAAGGQHSAPPFWRYRLCYAKRDQARYLSHLELTTALRRAMVRAGLLLRYTQGFNPRPRLAFGPALAVGAEGLCEYLDVELLEHMAADQLLDRLREMLPAGITLSSATLLPTGSRSIAEEIARAVYVVDADPDLSDLVESLPGRLAACSQLRITRRHKKGFKELDLMPLVLDLRVEVEGRPRLTLTVSIGQQGSTRPTELLEALLGDDYPGPNHFHVLRTALLDDHGRPLLETPPPTEEKCSLLMAS